MAFLQSKIDTALCRVSWGDKMGELKRQDRNSDSQAQFLEASSEREMTSQIVVLLRNKRLGLIKGPVFSSTGPNSIHDVFTLFFCREY